MKKMGLASQVGGTPTSPSLSTHRKVYKDRYQSMIEVKEMTEEELRAKLEEWVMSGAARTTSFPDWLNGN